MQANICCKQRTLPGKGSEQSCWMQIFSKGISQFSLQIELFFYCNYCKLLFNVI